MIEAQTFIRKFWLEEFHDFLFQVNPSAVIFLFMQTIDKDNFATEGEKLRLRSTKGENTNGLFLLVAYAIFRSSQSKKVFHDEREQ
jgi:hypothetical protein